MFEKQKTIQFVKNTKWNVSFWEDSKELIEEWLIFFGLAERRRWIPFPAKDQRRIRRKWRY